MNQLNWYMARRYFFAKRTNRFISWVGGISILGIAIGVIALIVTMAILNGFESEVTRRITNFIPHIVVSGDHDTEQLEAALPEASAIYRSTERKAVLEFMDEKIVLNVRAIDQNQWDHLLVSQSNTANSPGRLKKMGEEFPGIVIGASIADRLFLTVGDLLTIQSPLDMTSGLFRIPQRHFVVTGIFKSEIFDFDRSLAIIDYREGRRLFKSVGEQFVHIQLDDFWNAEQAKQTLAQAMPELTIKTWYDQYKTLFDAMQMEKWGSFIGLNLIILVAVFNIVSSLMMMVLEKTGDIGILRVMGAHERNVRQIFNLQGLLVAILGVVLGLSLGVGLVLSQQAYGWIKLPEDIYLIPVLPVHLIWQEVLLVGLAAFSIVLFSVRYPAKKAARLKPLDAINYKH